MAVEQAKGGEGRRGAGIRQSSDWQKYRREERAAEQRQQDSKQWTGEQRTLPGDRLSIKHNAPPVLEYR
jgi:hypothetical protein